jgi:hypothetical protein
VDGTPILLNASTVFNDSGGQRDTLTGGAGRDWFFAANNDTVTDRVTAGPSVEFLVPL